ncbi:ribonuclease 1 [Medicago truncatula]|uniref:ribonuclease 1 n=1 Tax=Medicago truncatula TaxID=3880 RepID=UPI000D2F15C5|nr:ribonuclease 1 [Medicago truncatula]
MLVNQASIAKPFLQSPTQFLPSTLEEPIAKPLEEPDVRKGRKKPPRHPQSPPGPPPPPPHLTFDHFKLAETWPPTFCKDPANNCFHDWPTINRFIIHGLWPAKKGSDELKDCDKHYHAPSTEHLNGIHTKLTDYWPSLHKAQFQVQANINFWLYEWKEHGTCSVQLLNFHDYFNVAIKLYQKHKILDILKNAGIKPGGTYSPDEISDAISKHVQFTPQIQCKKIGEISYLSEVRLCFTASKDPQYINCDHHGSLFGHECDAEVHF